MSQTRISPETVDARIHFLRQLIERKEKALEGMPDGKLKGISHGSGYQYYIRKNDADRSGTYIRRKDLKLAKKLGQKEYDVKVLNAARKELQYLERMKKGCAGRTAEEIYGAMPLSFQELIQPIEETDEQYVKRWQSIQYTPAQFYEDTKVYHTAGGIAMRSKSETMIGNLLDRRHIPYCYEKPLELRGYKTIYPDFTLLHVGRREEIYLEHMGLLDDRGYRDAALEKIRAYELNGIFPGDRLILTYETQKIHLNLNLIDRQLTILGF